MISIKQAIARAREQVDYISTLDVADESVLEAIRRQQAALELIHARFEQHTVGGRADHPDLRQGGD